ncbi:hypothetical protein EGW08_002052 [Elysia chlorotica]|uniref:Uncharacterized protein n=1 Tax=Elysia chlorotica TaxID=188477 RepID=A0A433U8N1_ELYCH|nr:hypothetical protein EGW08_002052 [Elysia chlorotica]
MILDLDSIWIRIFITRNAALMEPCRSNPAFAAFLLIFTAATICSVSGNEENKNKNGGYWTEWSEVSECSATCGSGTRRISRTYIPGPDDPTYEEPYMAYKTFTCNNVAFPLCPSNGVWSGWGPWSECTNGCGGGERKRRRTCSKDPAGKDCEGDNFDEEKCNKEPCPRLPAHFDMSQCLPDKNFTCASGKMCIPAAHKCDSTVQCHDGTDEMGCPPKPRWGNVRYDLRDGAPTLPQQVLLLGLVMQSITCFILTRTVWHY